MGGAPEAGDAGGDAGKRVGARGGGQTHGRGRGVLLVIGVQGEDPVHRAGEDRVHLVFLGRDREAHAQEVRRIVEIVARIHEGLADRIFVGHRRDGRHLGDQADRGDLALMLVIDVGAVVVEGGHRADHADHGGHRMRVAAEATEEVVHLLVDHRVTRHQRLELLELRRRGQLAVEQQVAHLEVMRLLGELVDRVAPMQQHARFAIDIGDGAVAGRGRGKARIIGEDARLRIELADVDDLGPVGGGVHRQIVAIAVDRQLRGLGRFGHSGPLRFPAAAQVAAWRSDLSMPRCNIAAGNRRASVRLPRPRSAPRFRRGRAPTSCRIRWG